MFKNELSNFVLSSIVLFLVLASALVHLVVRSKNREREYELEKQRLQFELDNKELVLGFQDRELVLREIAVEVKENIGQLAHLVRMNLHLIEENSGADTAQVKLVRYVSGIVDRIIDAISYLGHTMNGDLVKSWGLYRMLEHQLEIIKASGKINCFIDSEGLAEKECLSAEQQLLLYRIAKEAIDNVMQHAKADNLELQLVYDKHFKLVVRDDGIGFDEAKVDRNCTMGLATMQQRADLLNAELRINSRPGKGCVVSLYCKS